MQPQSDFWHGKTGATYHANGAPYTLADCLRHVRSYPSIHFRPVMSLLADGWKLSFVRRGP